jgi:hypothetical protein
MMVTSLFSYIKNIICYTHDTIHFIDLCAYLTAEDDCDEDVIFEEDGEESEGYLFAGQATYMKINSKMLSYHH